MDGVKKRIKPHGHFIKDRGTEIFLGLLMFFIGALLLYDAFDARGKELPWPANKLAPW